MFLKVNYAPSIESYFEEELCFISHRFGETVSQDLNRIAYLRQLRKLVFGLFFIESGLSSCSGVTDVERDEFLLFDDGYNSTDRDNFGIFIDCGDLLDVVELDTRHLMHFISMELLFGGLIWINKYTMDK